jgi:subtilase family serine protease
MKFAPDRPCFAAAKPERRLGFASAKPAATQPRRNFIRCALICIVANALALAGGARAQTQVSPEFRVAARSLITQTLDRSRMVPTQGAVRPEAARLPDLGEVDGTLSLEHIQLVLRRPSERQAAFDGELEALHTPGNQSFHRWLSPATVGSEFGPSASDIATTTSFLQAEGFTLNFVGQSGIFVDFTGTAAQVEHTFLTSIHSVIDTDGSLRYAAVQAASIPEALAPAVIGFVSLSDIRVIRPLMRKVVAPLDTVSPGSAYYVGPQDFYTIYNENPLLAAPTPINGTGRTIALIEESDIDVADVTTFRTAFNVLPNSPSLTVLHGSGSVTCRDPGKLNSSNDDEEPEAALDVEWAGAVAPGANLIFMSCKSTRSTAGIFLSAEAVIDNNLADVLSLSYGNPEAGSPTEDTLTADLWEQAASQGETVVVSSGDSGSDVEDQDASVATHGINVSGFASTAWNVAAGGTDFQDYYNQLEGASSFGFSAYWNSSNGAGYSSAIGYVPEMPWNDTCASTEFNFYNTASTDPAAYCATGALLATGGGSGGPSTVNPRPSWQTGTVYGLPTLAAQPNRMQPDISLFASNGVWGHALDYIDTDEGSGTQFAGGTSFVAPQLAGVFALIAQKTGERQGQPNYVLYKMAGTALGTTSYTGSPCNASGSTGTGATTTAPVSSCIFYDVAVGNNSQGCTAGTTNCYSDSVAPDGILSTSTSAADPAFPALQGYDMATGLGSVNIDNLVLNWQSTTASELLTPSVAVTSTVSSYTYGSPASSTYAATVSGSGSFPTGSVTFSASPTIGTIASAVALVPSSGCTTGSPCSEAATQAYTPSATLPAGSYTVTATYSTTNENYISAFGTTTLTVSRQTSVVTVAAVSEPYGNLSATLSATVAFTGSGAAPSGAVTFQVDTGATVAASCNGTSTPLTCTATYSVSSLASGSHTITASIAADTNYSAASKNATLSLTMNPATISFSVASPQHTFSPEFTVSATSNSPGAFTYSVVSGPATVSGSTVTLTGPGTVVLDVSQAATSVYSTTTATASFTVLDESIWTGNSNSSLSVLDPTGTALSSSAGFTGGGLGTISGPFSLAFDTLGDAWIASSNGISEFSPQGAALTSTAYTSGGISNPGGVAIDGASQVWIANANGTVSQLSHFGPAVSPSAGYTTGSTSPGGIAIDLGGSVWITGSGDNTVTRILGVAAPAAPLATSLANGTTGAAP